MKDKIIYADTIYDICKQQDCLTPECTPQTLNSYIISPSKNGTNNNVVFQNGSINLTTPADNIYYIPSNYSSVQIVTDSFVTTLSVKFFKENLTRKGYYDLTIEYRFDYVLQFFDSQDKVLPVYIQNTAVNQVQAYSIYTKHVTLCGGNVKNTVTTLNSVTGQCSSNLPEYNIQSTADVLKIDLCKVSDLTCNSYVDQSQNSIDPLGVYTVCVTIGLFTIISLFRQRRLNISADKDICIPTCDNPYSDPCEDFCDTPFPYDLFITPDCKRNNCR